MFLQVILQSADDLRKGKDEIVFFLSTQYSSMCMCNLNIRLHDSTIQIKSTI